MMDSVRKYVYLNPENDADILHWLTTQKNESEAIRYALRAWMRGGEQKQVEATVDLNAIRQVVEAALDARLSGLSVMSTPEEAGDETQELLDDMVKNLVM